MLNFLSKLQVKPELKTISWKNPIHFLALGFGSGLAPVAPGTFGTVAAIPVYLLLAFTPNWFFLAAIIAFAIAGFYICGYTANSLKTHDHPAIVWDEVVGYLITVFAMPFNWQTVVVGFILFRIFDILKPWPIRWLDKFVHGGIGIMLDDIVAGLFAWVCLFALYYYGLMF